MSAQEGFNIRCGACGEPVSFNVEEVPELSGHIVTQEANAFAEGKDEGFAEGEAEALSSVGITGGSRPLWELAAAIRRGDRFEAELQLDRIAEEMGPRAIEDVQQGRFSLRAAA
ncbi:MAG: hypothetical protein AB7E55_29985 [Pigmentiphaga sp.]